MIKENNPNAFEIRRNTTGTLGGNECLLGWMSEWLTDCIFSTFFSFFFLFRQRNSTKKAQKFVKDKKYFYRKINFWNVWKIAMRPFAENIYGQKEAKAIERSRGGTGLGEPFGAAAIKRGLPSRSTHIFIYLFFVKQPFIYFYRAFFFFLLLENLQDLLFGIIAQWFGKYRRCFGHWNSILTIVFYSIFLGGIIKKFIFSNKCIWKW